MYVLSVEPDCVVINDWLDRRTVIKSLDHFNEFMSSEAARLNRDLCDIPVYNSSTMDFPQDSTSNPQVLRLVAELNGDFDV